MSDELPVYFNRKKAPAPEVMRSYSAVERRNDEKSKNQKERCLLWCAIPSIILLMGVIFYVGFLGLYHFN